MRYQYVGNDYEEIAEGDEFMVIHCTRFRGRINQGPFPVIRVSKTQFTLQQGEETQNYMRSYGNPVGQPHGGTSAKPATAERIKDCAEWDAQQVAEKQAETDKADRYEQKLRERYGAQHIDCADTQKLLGQVRSIAEEGRGHVKQFLKIAKKASQEEPYGLMRALDNWDRSRFERGLIYRDRATDLHEEMCELYEAHDRGNVNFKVRDGNMSVTHKPTEVPAHSIVRAALNVARRKLETEFFGHRYDDDNSEYEAEFIAELRKVEDLDHDYPSISTTREGS